MNSSNWPYYKEWVLTQEALNKMLQQLDPDIQRAALEYEIIRSKLTKFFQYRGCAFPEEYADETINRVIRKIDAGEVIRADNPAKYFLGVAHNVLREQWRKSGREADIIDIQLPQQQPFVDPRELVEQEAEKQHQEICLKCLECCLQRLPRDSRELIMEYYSESGRVGIEKRQELAQQLGVQLNNLRIKMHRLRAKLEQCVQRCLKDEGKNC
ncbi:MAG: hypothetical protein AB1489_17935 [Acidobacteriota bacterium]